MKLAGSAKPARATATYMPIIRNSPWAKLTSFITPNIKFRPTATSAHTPPISNPLTTACASTLIAFIRRTQTRSCQKELGLNHLRSGDAFREHGVRNAALPLYHDGLDVTIRSVRIKGDLTRLHERATTAFHIDEM